MQENEKPGGVSSIDTSPRILLGSGRSGTTWIQDCLAEANSLRPIFEPLHPVESTLGSRRAYDVLTRKSQDEELERLFTHPDSSPVAKRWAIHRVSANLLYPRLSEFGDKDFAKSWLKRWWRYSASLRRNRRMSERENIIVKCIRANLMVDWLANGLNLRVAMIIRHPCAVVESMHRLGGSWDPRSKIREYTADKNLHELTDGRYEELLGGSLSTIEALCLNWVIENQWPYEHSKNGGYSVTFYEDLFSDSRDSWKELCASLSLAHVPAEDLINRPSQQTYRKGEEFTKISVSPPWRRGLNKSQLSDIQGILDKTDCQFYSVEDNNPL